MKTKAVSPLVATVLLVAFTVAIGGILSVWLSSFTKTQTATVESSSEKQIKCAASTLTIKEATYKGTIINVTTYYDSGTEVLNNFTVYVTGGGYTNSSGTSYVYINMLPGEANVTSISVVGGASIPPDYVRAVAFCQNKTAVVGECKAGQPCMKAG